MGSEATMGKATVTGGDVVVYAEKGGRVRLEVRLEGETVWLSLTQMAELFGRDKSVISRHLHTVFATGELKRAATVAENATVQREGGREVTRQVEYFNLDAILSVGYRVNSKRGTQVRIWATRTLSDHLLRSYTLNERRLREKGMGDMEQAVGLLAPTLKGRPVAGGLASGRERRDRDFASRGSVVRKSPKGGQGVSQEYVETRDGGNYVTGTRVSLDSIVYAFLGGQTAEAIGQAFPVLTLEQVYGALTFYLAHREAVDGYLAAQRSDMEARRQAAREADPMFYQKLAAARRTAIAS